MISQPIKIIPKRDYDRKWKDNNPTLRKYELASILMDDGSILYKIGDGITPYSDLPFISNINDIPHIYVYIGDNLLAAKIELNPFDEEIVVCNLSDILKLSKGQLLNHNRRYMSEMINDDIIIKLGELCYNRSFNNDDIHIKIGDGITPYKDLQEYKFNYNKFRSKTIFDLFIQIPGVMEHSEYEAILCGKNRILTAGEIQLSIDRYIYGLPCIKLGDGITPYSELPFIDG